MKIAYLFPGQGSQYIGMGKDLYEEYESAKKIYDLANELTGIDVKEISFTDKTNILNETKYTQLAILTHSLSILSILTKKNIKPYASAGLSLGEYSALINAGVIKLEDGIKLVKKRGEFMQELAPKDNFLMAAILGLDDDVVEKVCSSLTDVYPANYNCRGQVVISGLEEQVNKAIEILKEQGAKVMPLKTSGPFHTKFLKDSKDALEFELKYLTYDKPNNKVIKNIDGKPYDENSNYIEILSNHIISPVKFTQTIETMLEDGVNTFIEIGPGKTLSNLVKKISKTNDKEVTILNISDKTSLEKTLEYLKENENE